MISLARKPVEANLAQHDGERMRWCFTPLPTEVRKVSDFPINGGDFGATRARPIALGKPNVGETGHSPKEARDATEGHRPSGHQAAKPPVTE